MSSQIKTLAQFFLCSCLLLELTSCSPFTFFYYSVEGKKSRNIRLSLYRRESVNIGLQDGDTLVDIGSGYGEANINLAIAQPGVHQILIDTNREFLNERNIQKLKKKIDRKTRRDYVFSYEIFHNNADTIPLPSGTFKKVLYRKTLHELGNVPKMMAETRRILREDGELIIIEANPLKPGEIDLGCKRKHLSVEDITKLVSAEGFIFTERIRENIYEKKDSIYFNVVKFRKNQH